MGMREIVIDTIFYSVPKPQISRSHTTLHQYYYGTTPPPPPPRSKLLFLSFWKFPLPHEQSTIYFPDGICDFINFYHCREIKISVIYTLRPPYLLTDPRPEPVSRYEELLTLFYTIPVASLIVLLPSSSFLFQTLFPYRWRRFDWLLSKGRR